MKKYLTIIALATLTGLGLSGCAVLDSAFTQKVAVYDESGQPVLNADGTQKYIYEESAFVESIIEGSKAAGGPWYWVGSGIALFAGAYVSYKNGKNKGLIVADAIAEGVDIYRDQLDAVKGGDVAGDKLVDTIKTVASGTKVESEVNKVLSKTTTPDKAIAGKITFDEFVGNDTGEKQLMLYKITTTGATYQRTKSTDGNVQLRLYNEGAYTVECTVGTDTRKVDPGSRWDVAISTVQIQMKALDGESAIRTYRVTSEGIDESDINGEIDNAGSAVDAYTKAEADGRFAAKASTESSIQTLNGQVSSLDTTVQGLNTTVAGKADASALANYVPTSRTVNGKPLTSNVTLSATDVGSYPTSTIDDQFVKDSEFTSVLEELMGQISGKADASALAGYVPTSRTVNGKALSANVSLAPADINQPTEGSIYTVGKCVMHVAETGTLDIIKLIACSAFSAAAGTINIARTGLTHECYPIGVEVWDYNSDGTIWAKREVTKVASEQGQWVVSVAEQTEASLNFTNVVITAIKSATHAATGGGSVGN